MTDDKMQILRNQLEKASQYQPRIVPDPAVQVILDHMRAQLKSKGVLTVQISPTDAMMLIEALKAKR